MHSPPKRPTIAANERGGLWTMPDQLTKPILRALDELDPIDHDIIIAAEEYLARNLQDRIRRIDIDPRRLVFTVGERCACCRRLQKPLTLLQMVRHGKSVDHCASLYDASTSAVRRALPKLTAVRSEQQFLAHLKAQAVDYRRRISGGS